MLHLQREGAVDHCVAVDCLESVIFDPEDNCRSNFSDAALQMCGDDAAMRIRFAAIRIIIVFK